MFQDFSGRNYLLVAFSLSVSLSSSTLSSERLRERMRIYDYNQLIGKIIENNLPEVQRMVAENSQLINSEGSKIRLTPLHWAAYLGLSVIAEFLFKQGANVNAEDLYGWTPIKKAASSGHRDVVELVLNNGANIEGGSSVLTPLQHAAEEGHLSVVQLLIERGAHKEAQTAKGLSVLDLASARGHSEVARYLRDQ